jgi:hypothetical protein
MENKAARIQMYYSKIYRHKLRLAKEQLLKEYYHIVKYMMNK